MSMQLFSVRNAAINALESFLHDPTDREALLTTVLNQARATFFVD